MKFKCACAVIAVCILAIPACTTTSAEPTDDEVRQQMIDESIRSYSGNCPCPYHRASNGSQCGRRSAYSKPGGAEPLCYKTDISDDMVEAYRKKHAR